jgi:hypothetical protein
MVASWWALRTGTGLVAGSSVDLSRALAAVTVMTIAATSTSVEMNNRRRIM